MALTPELASKIEKLLAAATGGALVRSMEQCYSMLMEAGLLYQQKVHSNFIGVHPSNRDGCGVSAKHVHELLADLVGLGWSSSEFRGLCVEVSESERSQVYRWNQELAESSEGRVPGFPSETHLKYATLAGSHTNQVLRCFLNKVPSEATAGKVVTEGGRLSLERLQALDPDFHTACTEGAMWRIVSQAIPQRFPTFCGLAQSAANASGHVAREESELQLCHKIHGEVARCMATGKSTVNYVDVKDAVLRSKPRSAGTVPALFVFTLRFSGGQTAHFLEANDPGAQIRHMLLHFAYGVADGRALTVTDVKRALSAGMAAKREPAIALKAVGYLQMNMVEDRLFVRIDKWDRHFIQFVTGQPLELRKEKDPHHLSIPAFQNLLDLRKSACDKLYNKHLRDAAAVAGDAEPPHRSAREEDLYLAGRVVDMACPDVQLEEEFMPGQIVSALWSVRDLGSLG
ncbi:unnamed protein product [Symbiodinium sp. CCMP2456]|nr:unnamed protein product [Symbiodinium sp. CCMP2456]